MIKNIIKKWLGIIDLETNQKQTMTKMWSEINKVSKQQKLRDALFISKCILKKNNLMKEPIVPNGITISEVINEALNIKNEK